MLAISYICISYVETKLFHIVNQDNGQLIRRY